MAFFGLGKKAKIDTPQKALILACYTMVYFTDDGNIDENKVVLLNNISKSGKSLDKCPDLKNAEKFVDKHTLEECVTAVSEELTEDEQETVFVNLVDFALADGDINEDEKTLLEFYAIELDINEAIIDATLTIMFIKNRIS